MVKDRVKAIAYNKEFRDYVLLGIISAGMNIGLFKLLVTGGVRYRLANIITLVAVRMFVYVTNKLFVFRTRTGSLPALMREMLSFFLARSVTLLIDYFGVIILTETIGVDLFICKIITSIAVIICNYVLSKLYVFRADATGGRHH